MNKSRISCNHVIIQCIHNHEDASLALWALFMLSTIYFGCRHDRTGLSCLRLFKTSKSHHRIPRPDSSIPPPPQIQFSLASTSKQKQREEDGERGDRAAWRHRWRHSARPELAHLDPVLHLLQLLLFGSRRPHLRSAVQLRRERGQGECSLQLRIFKGPVNFMLYCDGCFIAKI